jgi:hypothetical protein
MPLPLDFIFWWLTGLTVSVFGLIAAAWVHGARMTRLETTLRNIDTTLQQLATAQQIEDALDRRLGRGRRPTPAVRVYQQQAGGDVIAPGRITGAHGAALGRDASAQVTAPKE